MVFWKEMLEKFFRKTYLFYIESHRFVIFISEDFQSYIQAEIW